jgi:uncharacterized protein
MKRGNKWFAFIGYLFPLSGFAQQSELVPDIQPVGFADVRIEDAFWKPKMDKVSTVTLQACINYTEIKTPRIRNFERAAAKSGQHVGIYYDDSDVYKALEAIAYSLRNHPDSVLEKKADEWIAKIAAAQMPDGYLDTYYQLRDISKRWTDIEKHEDYNAGHLMEAAIAYYNTTGKRELLDVAIRLANHIDTTFRLPNKHWVSGHEEIELALMKLYHLTNQDRYLQLASWYLEQRGHGYGYSPSWTDPKSHEYYQDDKTVRQSDKIKGHAVRAMYLYTGTADVAAETNDTGYLNAMERVWKDVVYRNMYLTGGIGSSGNNEGFTTDYDLPNVDAYCETCASVGMVLWNQRMNLLTGEAKYIDVLERSLYNAALDGLSLNGDRFFYGNPLGSPGQYERSEWFGTACCPANIARLVGSVGNYVYNRSKDAVWINLFVASSTMLVMNDDVVRIEQKTNYPWDGRVSIKISPQTEKDFDVYIRVPGWARDELVPGDLYHYIEPANEKARIGLNGLPVGFRFEKGYAVIRRVWKKGDELTINFPMEPRLVQARSDVNADKDKLAVQRGPIVYCFEGADNQGKAWNMLLPRNTRFESDFNKNLLGGVVTINAEIPVLEISRDGQSTVTKRKKVTAIPYFVWCNRGAGPMEVWVPERFSDIKLDYGN